MHDYVRAALSVIVVFLVERGPKKGLEHSEQAILIVTWLTPFFTIFSASTGLLNTSLLMPTLLAILCLTKLRSNKPVSIRMLLQSKTY